MNCIARGAHTLLLLYDCGRGDAVLPWGRGPGLTARGDVFLRFFYKKFVDLRLFSLHGLHPRNEPEPRDFGLLGTVNEPAWREGL